LAEVAVALIIAFVSSLTLTPWVRKHAFAWGAVDKPDLRKVHKEPMPRIGGLAVYLAFVLAVVATQDLNGSIGGLLVGCTLVVALGVVDDIKELPAKVKLLGQIAAAGAVIPFGVVIDYVTNPLSGDMLMLGWLAYPVTIFWLVAVTNAINLIDGLDGLAGGVSCIAALTLAAVAFTQWYLFGVAGMTGVVILALILAAAVLGFLRYNFHPAKIFLGDTGSMFLGFTLGAMSIMSFTKSATAISVFIPLVVLGLPLLDTFFAIVRRYHCQRPIFQPDKEHLHHQLMAMGLTHRQTVLAIYAVSSILGMSAVVLNVVSNDQAAAILVILSAVVIWLANRVGVIGGSRVLPVENSEQSQSIDV